VCEIRDKLGGNDFGGRNLSASFVIAIIFNAVNALPREKRIIRECTFNDKRALPFAIVITGGRSLTRYAIRISMFDRAISRPRDETRMNF